MLYRYKSCRCLCSIVLSMSHHIAIQKKEQIKQNRNSDPRPVTQFIHKYIKYESLYI